MAELGARCSNCFPPSLHPSSSIEDFISFLLHPYLAVNKSAGNPLRPFFKSVGSAFWELRPAGQGVSGERMPGQTGTQRPDTAPKCPHLGHTVPSSLALQCPCTVNRFGEKLPPSGSGNVGGIAHQLAGNNGPAHAIVPLLLLLLHQHNALHNPLRAGHITEADRTLEKSTL